jgi:hypothetical protein
MNHRVPVIALAWLLAAAPVASADHASASKKRNCHPNYKWKCLKRNAGDYDCAGGSGNGPNYVSGPVKVVGADPFRLDADHDGLGCE